jgi:pimeloyl-ACP methyl ester carboxylesterase
MPMSKIPEALFLSVSPCFSDLNQPLLCTLATSLTIVQWDYTQSLDEGNSLEAAIGLLHEYLRGSDRPIHLLGHGTSGLLGLLYARRYPEQVKSLTLMAVGVYPARDWQSHYYHNLQFLPCRRQMILTQMVYSLFGFQSQLETRRLVEILENGLQRSLSPHNAFQHFKLIPGGVPVPLLVMGSQDDAIVSPSEIQGWRTWMKEQDQVWLCPNGRHFFQSQHPQWISQHIFDFWASLEKLSSDRSALEMLYAASS